MLVLPLNAPLRRTIGPWVSLLVEKKYILSATSLTVSIRIWVPPLT
jgi:hypothetical protein